MFHRSVDCIENELEPHLVLKDWRIVVLNRLLPVLSLAMLPSITFICLDAFNTPSIPLVGVFCLVGFYLALLFVTFNHRMSPALRSWVFICLIYGTGVVALWRGGLAGDGRTYLIALAVISIILINLRAGIFFAILSMLTYGVFGVFAAKGLLTPWLVYHTNPLGLHDWLLNGLTLSVLIGLMIFISERSSAFQLQALHGMQRAARQLVSSNDRLEENNQNLERMVEQRTTQLLEANQRLAQIAMYDSLTGLPNRSLLYDRLRQAILISQRKGLRFALLFIDLDNFKTINDTYGHEIGDQLLVAFARLLQGCIRESDSACRLGGDEFVVLLNDIQSAQSVERVALTILEALREPIDVHGMALSITTSIGASLYPDNGDDPEVLLQKADLAMYMVKGQNKAGFCLFQAEPSWTVPQRASVRDCQWSRGG